MHRIRGLLDPFRGTLDPFRGTLDPFQGTLGHFRAFQAPCWPAEARSGPFGSVEQPPSAATEDSGPKTSRALWPYVG